MSLLPRAIKQLSIHQKIIITISLVLFILSLTQPAITYRDYDGQGTFSSLFLILIGGIGWLGGGLPEFFIWLSNPLYFVSLLLLLLKKKIAIKASIIATALSFSFVFWDEILISESGRNAKIIALKSGYGLWFASILVMTTGIIYQFIYERKDLYNKG